MNIMLLAAGEGTRLLPYTSIIPKPAMPFLTVPLAAHTLSFLEQVPIDHLVVNTFHLPAKLKTCFKEIRATYKNLTFSDEHPELLNSGGGLGKARKYFENDDCFILANADEVILPEDSEILKKAVEAHKKSKALGTLLVMKMDGVGTKFGGVWTDEKNQVLGFGKDPLPQSQHAWHFIGVQILSKEIFKYIPQEGSPNIFYDVMTAAIANSEYVQAFPISCTWFETGNEADFIEASIACLKFLTNTAPSYQKSYLEKTLNKFSLEDYLITVDSPKIFLRSRSASIHENAQLKGTMILGPHARVEKNCILENCILGSHAHVPEGTCAVNKLFL